MTLAHLLMAAASLEVLLPYDQVPLPRLTVADDCWRQSVRRSVYHRLGLQAHLYNLRINPE